MNAVVLMATPCPKSLHGKGEKWIARNILSEDSLLFAEKSSLIPVKKGHHPPEDCSRSEVPRTTHQQLR